MDGKDRLRPSRVDSNSSDAAFSTDGDRDALGLDFDNYLDNLPGGAALDSADANNASAGGAKKGSLDRKDRTWSSDSASFAVSTVQGGGARHITETMACPKALLNMVRKRHSIEKLSRTVKELKAAMRALGGAAVGAGGVARAPSKASRDGSEGTGQGLPLSSYDSDSVNTLNHSETEDEYEVFNLASPVRRGAAQGGGEGKRRSPQPRSGATPAHAATPPGMVRLHSPQKGILPLFLAPDSDSASVMLQGSSSPPGSSSGLNHGPADGLGVGLAEGGAVGLV